MCKDHDQLHYDWRVRAVAATMAGMDRVGPELRGRGEKTRDLLLRQATIVGLLDCLESGLRFIPQSKREQIRVRLLSLSAECQSEALAVLQSGKSTDEDVPF